VLRDGDGCVARHFPPILRRCSGATVLPPGSTLNFPMLFLKHDTRGSVQGDRLPIKRVLSLFGDCLSRLEERIYWGKNKMGSDVIHGIKVTSFGK
jgi:hypothetical protein